MNLKRIEIYQDSNKHSKYQFSEEEMTRRLNPLDMYLAPEFWGALENDRANPILLTARRFSAAFIKVCQNWSLEVVLGTRASGAAWLVDVSGSGWVAAEELRLLDAFNSNSAAR